MYGNSNYCDHQPQIWRFQTRVINCQKRRPAPLLVVLPYLWRLHFFRFVRAWHCATRFDERTTTTESAWQLLPTLKSIPFVGNLLDGWGTFIQQRKTHINRYLMQPKRHSIETTHTHTHSSSKSKVNVQFYIYTQGKPASLENVNLWIRCDTGVKEKPHKETNFNSIFKVIVFKPCLSVSPAEKNDSWIKKEENR